MPLYNLRFPLGATTPYYGMTHCRSGWPILLCSDYCCTLRFAHQNLFAYNYFNSYKQPQPHNLYHSRDNIEIRTAYPDMDAVTRRDMHTPVCHILSYLLLPIDRIM
eukprot:scaffold524401_cov22-Prasinocladus_malaysianus.AAC.1